jgi:hypothetical protein
MQLHSSDSPIPTRYHAPECRCGSRRTRRVGYLKRACADCGNTYYYRISVTDSGDAQLLPFSRSTAEAIDERRAS